MTTTAGPLDFECDAVLRLRDDLALALRAAAHHGLAEGVCNHFSIEVPDRSGRFLVNPRGLLWSRSAGLHSIAVMGRGRRHAGLVEFTGCRSDLSKHLREHVFGGRLLVD